MRPLPLITWNSANVADEEEEADEVQGDPEDWGWSYEERVDVPLEERRRQYALETCVDRLGLIDVKIFVRAREIVNFLERGEVPAIEEPAPIARGKLKRVVNEPA